MNEVKISGAFERGIEIRPIQRGDKELQLAAGSLSFVVPRGDKEVTMWIDVECVGDKAFEMADIPENIGVTVTGELRRAAWKAKQTDEWQSRHFIYYRSHTVDAEGYAEQPAPEDDIPF